MTTVQDIKIEGKSYVIIPRREYDRLVKREAEDQLPPMPQPNERGRYPAIETIRVTIARRLITDRKAAGLTQQALADLAGVRQETIARIESGKHTVGVKTMDKIDAALKQAGV